MTIRNTPGKSGHPTTSHKYSAQANRAAVGKSHSEFQKASSWSQFGQRYDNLQDIKSCNNWTLWPVTRFETFYRKILRITEALWFIWILPEDQKSTIPMPRGNGQVPPYQTSRTSEPPLVVAPQRKPPVQKTAKRHDSLMDRFERGIPKSASPASPVIQDCRIIFSVPDRGKREKIHDRERSSKPVMNQFLIIYNINNYLHECYFVLLLLREIL